MNATTTLRRLLVVSILPLFVVPSATLRAQSEPTSCAQSARAVASGRFTPAIAEVLMNCPVTGPSAVALAWKSGAAKSESDLVALVRSSRPTAEVYGAVLGVAKDGAQPRANRLAALQVVMQMHSPKLEAEPAWMLTANVGDPIPRSTERDGPSTAPASHVTDVPELLAALSWGDRDSEVRHAAQVLRQSLEFDDPGHSPLRPGTITLTAGCGGLVTLNSAENITLRLHLIFETGSQTYDIWLKGAQNGQPSAQRMYPPAGPITVAYGGQQVARITQRPNLVCRSK